MRAFMNKYIENTVAKEIMNRLLNSNETAWMKFKLEGHIISASLLSNSGDMFTVEFICGKNFVNMRLITNAPVSQSKLFLAGGYETKEQDTTFVPFCTNDGLWGENAFVDTVVMNERMDNILKEQLVPHINRVLNYISTAEKEGGVVYA